MRPTHHTHCALRLGDNLAALHFLRKLALLYREHDFIHFAHLMYIRELAEVVCDLPNVKVCDLESVHDHSAGLWEMKPWPKYRSIDLWKNAGGIWDASIFKLDYGRFMVAFFRSASVQMGLISPILDESDLVFDYPALAKWKFPDFDCLIVNSAPMSNQMPGWNPAQMENLVGELGKRWQCVTTARTRFAEITCTLDKQLTVTQIGALSRFCRYIIMVSTGPSWPCWNIWTQESCKFMLLLNGEEDLSKMAARNLGGYAAAQSPEEARQILQLMDIL